MISYFNIRAWHFVVLLAATAPGCGRVQQAEAQRSPLIEKDPVVMKKVVVAYDDTTTMQFVNNQALFAEGWDNLGQPVFWKQIMNLSPDSCIINVASSRTPLQTACYRTWSISTEVQKSCVKGSIRDTFCIPTVEELYVTSGKKEFYEHRKSIPTISKAIKYFNEYGVDPWFAQTILLIESPGKQSAKSSAGANGPFQLMRSVAMKYGLKVNKYVDERSDLKRAAYGASKLIGTICIPKVREMLNARNIAYNETDLWFRLLVLHAYHAGAGNLNCAINTINPTEGGQQLITTLWHTECGGFKNESQNYSQIALAAIMNFEEIIHADNDSVFLIQGDRQYQLYKNQPLKQEDGIQALTSVLQNYERDLVEGTIPFDYFLQKTRSVRNELTVLTGNPVKPETLPMIYPNDEYHYLAVSKELLRKRKVDDAIQLLRFNIENYPTSAASADSLATAFRINNNLGLQKKYMTKTSTQ
ncbi:hypothetical protein BH11BAC2_BH11BAC2_20540 [soil metagenome]